jgi:hypothetical protein
VDRDLRLFLTRLFLLGLPVLAAGAWLCDAKIGASARQGVLFGGALSLVNAVIGFLLLQWGLRRSSRALLGVVLGGFLGRLFVVVAALFLLVHLTAVDPYALGLAVVGFYFLFLVVEVYTMRDRLFPGRSQEKKR